MIMRSIIIVVLCTTVVITTHAAPSESHIIQAESQSSTIAQAILNFIVNLVSSVGNVKNSGGSREHTPLGKNGKVLQDESRDKGYLIPYLNLLYYLDSSLSHDAKLRQYESSAADPTSSSYPRKMNY